VEVSYDIGGLCGGSTYRWRTIYGGSVVTLVEVGHNVGGLYGNFVGGGLPHSTSPIFFF